MTRIPEDVTPEEVASLINARIEALNAAISQRTGEADELRVELRKWMEVARRTPKPEDVKP